MSVPTFHLSVSGSVVAFYGAVLATITGTVQIVNFLRDRRKIKISVQHNMEAVGLPTYKGMTMTIVTVANAGRRPVTITNVGAYRLHPMKAFVIPTCNPPIPRELTEGKYLTAILDQSYVDFSTIEAWEAYDALGNTYRLPVAPWRTRLLSRMRRKRAWRKEALAKKV